MSNVFSQPIAVNKAHIDTNRHVNNVVYVQWMQDVAYAHSCAKGYDNETLDRMGSTWVIRSHFIQYHRPALDGDQLTVHTWPSGIKRASALRKYKFVRDSDGAVVATGESDWVYIDRQTGRPRPIEDEMRAAFAVVPPEEEP